MKFSSVDLFSETGGLNHGFINKYEYNLAIGRREYENIDEIFKKKLF